VVPLAETLESELVEDSVRGGVVGMRLRDHPIRSQAVRGEVHKLSRDLGGIALPLVLGHHEP